MTGYLCLLNFLLRNSGCLLTIVIGREWLCVLCDNELIFDATDKSQTFVLEIVVCATYLTENFTDWAYHCLEAF